MDVDLGDLGGLIDDALTRAQASGLDRVGAARRAVLAVCAARPDLTPDEAYTLVELAAPVRTRSFAA
jgi:hypothetical protein